MTSERIYSTSSERSKLPGWIAAKPGFTSTRATCSAVQTLAAIRLSTSFRRSPTPPAHAKMLADSTISARIRASVIFLSIILNSSAMSLPLSGLGGVRPGVFPV